MNPDALSFLRARDPSILSFSTTNFDRVRVNLAMQSRFEETTASQETHEPECDGLKIYLRVKCTDEATNLYDIADNTISCKAPKGSRYHQNVKDGDNIKRTYNFTHIFGPNSTQHDLFEMIIRRRVFQFINGKNSTLLTYGASGSGKTYTIVGTEWNPGMVPRALEYIFRTLPTLPDEPVVKPNSVDNVTFLTESNMKLEMEIRNDLLTVCNKTIDKHHIKVYKRMQERLSTEPVAILEDLVDVSLAVWVSFAEIYNENIYDLLKSDPPRGRSRPKLSLGLFNGQTYIKNLSCVNVSSGLEAYQILQYGLHNLKYAATVLNPHSSRSHSIFTIKLAQAVEGGSGFHVSYIHFCDLAGSERLKKTVHVGERLKEANNINTSLLVLGRCINCIRDAQKKHEARIVPFRESKLTQLFQRALSGLEDIAMIVNMNPVRNMFDESIHVLNFSAIAKDIIVEHKTDKIVRSKNRFSQFLESKVQTPKPKEAEVSYSDDDEMDQLRQENFDLYNELERQKQEYVKREAEARERIRGQYNRLIDQVNAKWEEKLALEENIHQQKLESMREMYEKGEHETKDEKIICLDSSTDEDEIDDERTKSSKTIPNLPSHLNDYSLEMEMKSDEIAKLQEKITDLESILEDAEKHYNNMCETYQEKMCQLEKENVELNDKLVEMKMLEVATLELEDDDCDTEMC